MNKKDIKAWIRIIEAFLAILIVLGAVLVIMSRQPQRADIGEDIYEKQESILRIISDNETLRQDILSGDNSRVNSEISAMIPSSWAFSTAICPANEICNAEIPFDREIYSREVLINSDLLRYDFKKLRFSVWAE
jgi:hypothetical protein